MRELSQAEQESLCRMYRDGVALRTLEVAFGLTDVQIIDLLERDGVVQPEPGESREAFVERIRQDVKHQAGGEEQAA